MGAELIWTVPVRGDGRRARREEWNRGDWYAGLPSSPAWVTDDRRNGRFGPFDHIDSVVAAGEHGGFDGLLIPFDPEGDESWIVATVAARATRWARTILELAEGGTTPVYAAKLSATLQRASGGRLDWKLAVDLDPATAAALGDHVGGEERYARADEFLTVARAVWHGRGYDFDGRYYTVDSGGFDPPLNVDPFPRVFLSGNSPDALRLAARHADVHLLDTAVAGAGRSGHGVLDDAALDTVAAQLERFAREAGRPTPRLGLTLPVVAREDADEAWARVARLLEEREAGDSRDLEGLRVGPARWAGFDRLGFAERLGLVGSYGEVATELHRYVGRGIDVFVLDGYPHVEEAYRLGQHLLSRVDEPAPAAAPS